MHTFQHNGDGMLLKIMFQLHTVTCTSLWTSAMQCCSACSMYPVLAPSLNPNGWQHPPPSIPRFYPPPPRSPSAQPFQAHLYHIVLQQRQKLGPPAHGRTTKSTQQLGSAQSSQNANAHRQTGVVQLTRCGCLRRHRCCPGCLCSPYENAPPHICCSTRGGGGGGHRGVFGHWLATTRQRCQPNCQQPFALGKAMRR